MGGRTHEGLFLTFCPAMSFSPNRFFCLRQDKEMVGRLYKDNPEPPLALQTHMSVRVSVITIGDGRSVETKEN